jgi:hypothetical protein
MAGMTSQEQFDQAAGDVIHATVKIYVEVGHLLRDLRAQLQESMPVLPVASISDGNLALKVLKGWRGFLAAPELYEPDRKKRLQQADVDEEEAESGKGAGKMLNLPAGGNLLFGKFILHEFPRRAAPCFIGGVLCGAKSRGEDTSKSGFRFKSGYARGILRDLHPNIWTGTPLDFATDAKIQTPSGYSKKKGKKVPKLAFQLRHEPIRISLWELDGTDAAQKLAEDLLKHWNGAAAAADAIRA